MVKGYDKREAELLHGLMFKSLIFHLCNISMKHLTYSGNVAGSLSSKVDMVRHNASFCQMKILNITNSLLYSFCHCLTYQHLKCPVFVYSTFSFVKKEAEKYGVTPVCTFDRPLWWKALQIITCKDSYVSDIVIRLGGLHTIRSCFFVLFFASFGHIMAESCLKQALEICYDENTVPHIFSGKAISRVLRAHQLVDLTLTQSF